MKITSGNVRATLLTTTLALGLAACSSTPAPWSRPDNSPWSDRRNAEMNSAPNDEIVVQEPELAPEPLPEPSRFEALPIAEPEHVEVPPPTAYKAESVVSDINNEQQILSLPGNYYAVQAYAANSMESVETFKADHSLDNMMAVKTDRSGKIIYVLVETFDSRAAAQSAAAGVEAATGSKPWVRSVAGLQKIVAQ